MRTLSEKMAEKKSGQIDYGMFHPQVACSLRKLNEMNGERDRRLVKQKQQSNSK